MTAKTTIEIGRDAVDSLTSEFYRYGLLDIEKPSGRDLLYVTGIDSDFEKKTAILDPDQYSVTSQEIHIQVPRKHLRREEKKANAGDKVKIVDEGDRHKVGIVGGERSCSYISTESSRKPALTPEEIEFVLKEDGEEKLGEIKSFLEDFDPCNGARVNEDYVILFDISDRDLEPIGVLPSNTKSRKVDDKGISNIDYSGKKDVFQVEEAFLKEWSEVKELLQRDGYTVMDKDGYMGKKYSRGNVVYYGFPLKTKVPDTGFLLEYIERENVLFRVEDSMEKLSGLNTEGFPGVLKTSKGKDQVLVLDENSIKLCCSKSLKYNSEYWVNYLSKNYFDDVDIGVDDRRIIDSNIASVPECLLDCSTFKIFESSDGSIYFGYESQDAIHLSKLKSSLKAHDYRQNNIEGVLERHQEARETPSRDVYDFSELTVESNEDLDYVIDYIIDAEDRLYISGSVSTSVFHREHPVKSGNDIYMFEFDDRFRPILETVASEDLEMHVKNDSLLFKKEEEDIVVHSVVDIGVDKNCNKKKIGNKLHKQFNLSKENAYSIVGMEVSSINKRSGGRQAKLGELV